MVTSSPNSFTVISTFSGCGGSSLGYQLAGGKVLLAIEWDDNAVATYRLNFIDTPIYHGDICNLSVEECCELADIKPGELDILDGSPPCQGFSTAGKRDFSDNRNQLFREYIRLLRGLKPKVFVMENVSGMVKGKMRLIFVECLQELKSSGYKVKARLLNAMYFNVPQSRQRIIFVGVREDLGIKPGYPKAWQRPITVRQAIGHLPVGKPGTHQPQVLGAWHKSKPGQSLRKAVRYVGSFQSCRLDPDCPSPTLIKAHRHWHYAIARHLTDKEAAIIGSFPEEFRWYGTKQERQERIGNSVPPNFMRAIAEYIRDNILQRLADIGLEPCLEE